MKLYSISNIRKARKDSVAEAGNDTGMHFSAISSVQTSGMSVTSDKSRGGRCSREDSSGLRASQEPHIIQTSRKLDENLNPRGVSSP